MCSQKIKTGRTRHSGHGAHRAGPQPWNRLHLLLYSSERQEGIWLHAPDRVTLYFRLTPSL